MTISKQNIEEVNKKNIRGFTLGEEIPNFQCETNKGNFLLHEYLGSSWGVLFSHPDDFTPICTTELGEIARLEALGEFKARNVKVIGLSCNSVESHNKWLDDIKAATCQDVKYPIIADYTRKIASELGMLSSDDLDKAGLPLTVRSLFVLDPMKKIKLMLTYPASTGRNYDELLRSIDSLQLTSSHSVATPVNWKAGEKTVVVPSISTEEAQRKFPKGVQVVNLPSQREYLRYTPDPR